MSSMSCLLSGSSCTLLNLEWKLEDLEMTSYVVLVILKLVYGYWSIGLLLKCIYGYLTLVFYIGVNRLRYENVIMSSTDVYIHISCLTTHKCIKCGLVFYII